jgi:hypothetical protein
MTVNAGCSLSSLSLSFHKGRGGGSNNHIGNVSFRKLVGEHKVQYFAASKVQKPQVARLVVKKWRELDPPGRFLIRKDEPKKTSASRSNSNEGVWYEVGDQKAREKASQCLRERTADVVPYIKQIRQEQDALTEQGVMAFQESVERHKQQEAQRKMAEQAAAAQASQEAVPVTPSSIVSASELDMSFSGGSGHQGATWRGDVTPRYPSIPVPSFSRRTSCPTMAGPPPPASLHATSSGHRRASIAAMAPGMHPMHHTSVGGGSGAGAGHYEYGLPDQDFYYSESNLDYHASLVEMQRQMEFQERQMQEMQERMRAQQHQLRQHEMMNRQTAATTALAPTDPAASTADPHVATVSPDSSLDNDEDYAEYDPLPIDADDGLFMVIPVNNSSPDGTSVPLSRASHKSKRARDEGLGKENSDHSTNSRAKGGAEPTTGAAAATATDVRPDLPTSSGHVKAKESVATALTQALQANEEVTIEEYRRQLEAYMFSHHMGEPVSASHYGNGDGDDGMPSDLEDEDDEPKHQHGNARVAPRRRASRRGSRGGVDRTISGCSFMSTDTHLSANLSIFSNMSLLSDAQPSCGARERKMNMARSLSNLSLMSDVTDISNALDDLCL